jgi:tetratricopeptide (TPR) repeat protein
MKSILIAAILLIALNLNAQKSGLRAKSDTLLSINVDKLPPDKIEILKKLVQLDEIKNLITSEESNEKKASLYFDAGILSYDLDEYQEAVDYFSKSLELITYSKVYFNRALTYYQLDDFDNTLKDFESHLKLLETYDDLNEMRIIYTTKAKCYLEKSDYENAVNEYSNYLDLDDTDAEVLIRRAVSFGLLEKYKDAIYDFTKVIGMKSKVTKLQKAYSYQARGDAKYQLKDSYGAMEDLNKAILLAPQFKDSYKVRGNIYFAKNNYKLALIDYNKVLSIDKVDLDALVNRAKIKINLNVK